MTFEFIILILKFIFRGISGLLDLNILADDLSLLLKTRKYHLNILKHKIIKYDCIRRHVWHLSST